MEDYMKKDYKEIEEIILNPNACRSASSRRKFDEEFDSYQNPYQIDRQRIILCKAFRRLKRKTQVYISPKKDHYRTRLTHTLEVTNTARTMARALSFNEDLVEAISLGHDLGHTPFGHMGETVLNDLSSYGFKHYEQSVRVVDFLERINESFNGLNLTNDVIDGILYHTGDRVAGTKEGQILKFADRISYVNHDIEDALRAGIIDKEEIPIELSNLLGKDRQERLENMTKDLIENSSDTEINMSTSMYNGMMMMRKFLFDHVYYNDYVIKERDHVYHVLSHLYHYYFKNIDRIPRSHLDLYSKSADSNERIIIDYLSGMTDSYIIFVYEEIFIPSRWKL